MCYNVYNQWANIDKLLLKLIVCTRVGLTFGLDAEIYNSVSLQ